MIVPDAIAEALGALAIDGPASYVWLGQRFEVPGANGSADLADLESALRQRLYADFYCTGGIAPPAAEDDRRRRPGPGPAGELEALSTANAGRGAPQPGWVVRGRDGAAVVVERDGLRLWADPARVIGAGCQPGDEVVVVLPKESLGLPRGFYTAYGDAGDGTGCGVLDRFYWNIRAEGRSRLVALLTGRLNDAGLPFRAKVLNDPNDVRCDAGVLYTPSDRRPRVVGLLDGLLTAVARHLRPNVPALTLRLAPGLAFAEDPPGEYSFGQHRSRLVAAALVEAHRRGVRDPAGRAAIVGEWWAQEGLALGAPHLNPGSDAGRDPPALAP